MILKLKISLYMCLVLSFCGQAQSSAIIVTVDGLDFSKILGQKVVLEDYKIKLNDLDCSFTDWNNYLGDALNPLEVQNSQIEVNPFVWERSSAYTKYYVESLCNYLNEQYSKAKSNNRKLIIVAHSWGTFLTYAALSSKYNSEDDPIICDLLITLGCPLGTIYANKNKIKDPFEDLVSLYVNEWLDVLQLKRTANMLKVKEWYNFWNFGDMISGPLKNRESNVTDLEIFPPGMKETKAHQYRNALSTTNWHKYNSLQSGGTINNSNLIKKVFELIKMQINSDSEDFDAFLNKFFNNEKFQKERIQFPLAGSVGNSLELESEYQVKWEKNYWKFLRRELDFYGRGEGENYFKNEIVDLNDSKLLKFLYWEDSEEFLFELKNKKWLLTNYDNSFVQMQVNNDELLAYKLVDNRFLVFPNIGGYYVTSKNPKEIKQINITANAEIIDSFEGSLELTYIVSQNLTEGQECTIFDLSNNKLMTGYISFIDGSNVTIVTQQIFNNKKLKTGDEVFVEF